VRPRSSLLAVMLALGALPGCNDLEVCGARREDVLGADGGLVRCATDEECPLGARPQFCRSDATPEQECVSCLGNGVDEPRRCVRTVPERCE
jgi:hypothetical protein